MIKKFVDEEFELILEVRNPNNPNELVDPDLPPILKIPSLNITESIPEIKSKGVFSFKLKINQIGSYLIKFIYFINNNRYEKEDTLEIVPHLKSSPVKEDEIIIDEKHLDLIKQVIGKPFLDEFGISDADIKKYAVYPALLEYFRKFPITVEDQVAVSNATEIPFPDDFTYGVLDARIVGKGETYTSSSFWDIIRFQTLYPSLVPKSIGVYGSKFNFNQLNQLNLMAKAVYDTYGNLGTYKIKIDYPNRKIIAYCSFAAFLNFTWAKYSLNFKDVRFERINDVINLARMNLLYLLVDFAALYEDSQIDRRINADALRTKAEFIYNEVLKEGWRQIPDVVLLRGEIL